MPKKVKKTTLRTNVKQKVIVNVNTGRRVTNRTTQPRQPPSTGSFPKMMILQPQPQIQPTNLLQPQSNTRIQELEKQLELQKNQSAQQTKLLQDAINARENQIRLLEENAQQFKDPNQIPQEEDEFKKMADLAEKKRKRNEKKEEKLRQQQEEEQRRQVEEMEQEAIDENFGEEERRGRSRERSEMFSPAPPKNRKKKNKNKLF